jgi:hypothetical protein
LIHFRKGAQQYNFTTSTWRQLASLGSTGFQYFGCVLIPNTQDKILLKGDLDASNPNSPIILDVPNNKTIPVKHSSNALQMAYLVSDTNKTIFRLL